MYSGKTKHGLIYSAPGNRDKVHTRQEREAVSEGSCIEEGLSSKTPMCPEVEDEYGFASPYWLSSTND